ncbi:GNAT family N-acetyltransferase [Rhizobium leguminosarum]|uniref:GNAT family N-acetyltransferase n=1 Tax=Rhizobium leguminosarum TaxID=384 RepID=UPI001441FA39|nr:GNAT family N-acetyltransferase [Rhizobium leguminosarum]NKN03075.1 GNAT family N-acetyltransferase [Rhizobium leguminosarum bv. viciae]
MTSYPVFLTDKRTGEPVAAELIETISEADLRSVEAEWKPVTNAKIREIMAQGRSPADWPEGWHWMWREKMIAIGGLLAFQTFALRCEGKLQGLMQLNTARYRSRVPEQAGKDLVYVDYVETAPWNRKAIVADPRFGGVGTIMIRAAIEVSRDQEFRGRIGLHSLPSAEAFYANACGMTDLGLDGTYEGLRYFEMTSAQADAFSG